MQFWGPPHPRSQLQWDNERDPPWGNEATKSQRQHLSFVVFRTKHQPRWESTEKLTIFLSPSANLQKYFASEEFTQRFPLFFKEISNIKLLYHSLKRSLPSFFLTSSPFCFLMRKQERSHVDSHADEHEPRWLTAPERTRFLEPLRRRTILTFENNCHVRLQHRLGIVCC